jgi:hypothetical protein
MREELKLHQEPSCDLKLREVQGGSLNEDERVLIRPAKASIASASAWGKKWDSFSAESLKPHREIAVSYSDSMPPPQSSAKHAQSV